MKKEFFFKLLDAYQRYHHSAITTKRFEYEKIISAINSLTANKRFFIEKVGYSFEERTVYLVQWGQGDTKILLWSQMHGDESTATRALLDVWKFLDADDDFNEIRNDLFIKTTLIFIPVLNPDGANLFQRRTVQGIDMNRDAVKLQTPEARILKGAIDRFNPEFGFNLHDQSPYYGAGESPFPASISFLAPAYNHAKEINTQRDNAMSVIGFMNNLLQKIIPGHVGRYDDTFNPRAFGDNIQKWGTSTILVESGGYPGDGEKEYLRKLNFALLLASFNAIAHDAYRVSTNHTYDSIPFNMKERFFDLLIRNAVIEIAGKDFKVDIGINREEVNYYDHSDYYFRSIVEDMGDLALYHGYEELNVNGMKVKTGKCYPYRFETQEELQQADFDHMLKNGYTSVVADDAALAKPFCDFPVNLVHQRKVKTMEFNIKPEGPADFIVLEELEVRHTIVNGFVVNYSKTGFGVKNGLAYGY